MATRTLLTVEQFEQLPEEEHYRYELDHGELIEVSCATYEHNEIRGVLEHALRAFLEAHRVGRVIAEQEFDFLGNAHGPDVSVMGPAKGALLELDRRVQRFVPDLAIEVASESDTYEGLLAKKERYLKSGTAEVWLFSLRTRELAIFGARRNLTLRGADAITTDLLPGFSITVDELLQGL